MLQIQTTEWEKKELSEYKLFLIWGCAIFMTTMNTTMFSVALPTIQKDLMIGISAASWVISGYSVVLALSTLTFSRLSEYVSILRLLILGIIILSAASILGYFSHHYVMLLFSRLFQAVGAGSIVSLAVVAIIRFLPTIKRAKMLAITSSSAVLGLGLGPVVDGVIDQFLGWNFLFLVTGSIFMLIPVFIHLLPKENNVEKIRFDFTGCILVSLAVISMMLFLTSFQIGYIVVFIIFITLSGRHLKKSPYPFLRVELVRNKAFVYLLIISFFTFFVYFSTLFIVPFILTDLFQMKSMEIGLLILPGGVLSVIVAERIGYQINRHGNIPIIFIAKVIFMTTMVLFIAFLSKSSTFILIAFLLMSPGFTALTASARNEASKLFDEYEVESGVGLIQMIQFFGASTGVTWTGTLLNLRISISAVEMDQIVFSLLLLISIASILLLYKYRKIRLKQLKRVG